MISPIDLNASNEMSIVTARHANATPAPGPTIIRGSAGDDTLGGGPGDDIIQAGDGDDDVYDEEGFNYLLGGAGSDTLVGAGIFNGGPGNDMIAAAGDASGNVYQYAKGDGFDTISAAGDQPVASGQGMLQFGAGVSPSAVGLVRDDHHLSLTMDHNDQITLVDWFKGPAFQLAQVSFADGTVWRAADIAAMDIAVLGTQDDDVLQGFPGNNLIHAGHGDDYVVDGEDNNLIYGGEGNDTLIGRGVLDGGPGNDTLVALGNAENNVYFFDTGDGQDTLYAHSDGNPGRPQGTVAFGTSLDPARLWFRRQDDDLLVSLVGSSEGMTIRDWYPDLPNRVARFVAGDDRILSHERVETLVQAMAAFAAPTSGSARLAPHVSQALAPVLAASWARG